MDESLQRVRIETDEQLARVNRLLSGQAVLGFFTPPPMHYRGVDLPGLCGTQWEWSDFYLLTDTHWILMPVCSEQITFDYGSRAAWDEPAGLTEVKWGEVSRIQSTIPTWGKLQSIRIVMHDDGEQSLDIDLSCGWSATVYSAPGGTGLHLSKLNDVNQPTEADL